MNSSDYKITLDIHSMSAPISLNVKKGDTGRRICICLTERGVPYKIKPGCYAVFTGKKPDEKILWNSCIIEGDTIIYEITEQTTNVVGWLPVQIRLYGAGGKLISSPDFVLIVDGVTVEDDELVSVSENEVTALTELIADFTVLGQEAPLNVNIENIADGADKTYSEIEAADEAGRMVLLNFKSWIYVMDKFGPIHPGEKAFYKFYPVITASNHDRVPRDAFVVYEDNTWVEIDTGFEHLTEEKVLDLIEDNAPDVLTEEEVITLVKENAPKGITEEDVNGLIDAKKELFIAVYNTTTWNEIVDAHNAGKICFAKNGNSYYPLACATHVNPVDFRQESVFMGLSEDSYNFVVIRVPEAMNGWEAWEVESYPLYTSDAFADQVKALIEENAPEGITEETVLDLIKNNASGGGLMVTVTETQTEPGSYSYSMDSDYATIKAEVDEGKEVIIRCQRTHDKQTGYQYYMYHRLIQPGMLGFISLSTQDGTYELLKINVLNEVYITTYDMPVLKTTAQELTDSQKTQARENIGAGTASEWSDLGESATGGDTLTWDGNTEGRDTIDMGGGMFIVKMSDCIPTEEDFANGFTVKYADGTSVSVAAGGSVDSGAAPDGAGGITVFLAGGLIAMIAPYDNYADIEGLKAGFYFVYVEDATNYISSFTIHGYTGFPAIKPVPEKYLPMDAIMAEIESRYTNVAEVGM